MLEGGEKIPKYHLVRWKRSGNLRRAVLLKKMAFRHPNCKYDKVLWEGVERRDGSTDEGEARFNSLERPHCKTSGSHREMRPG